MPGWMKWVVALLIGFGVIAIGVRFWSPLLTIFFVMNCLVLVVVVLLQSGKAADLAGAFGGAGSQTAFGPRGAATILSQATTWCAVMFMVCAMALALRSERTIGTGRSVFDNISKPASKPAVPATTPAPSSQQAPANQAPATPGGAAPAGTAPAAPAGTSQNPKK